MDGIMTALLALCAIMVVFSTIVTIMQEAMHKGFQSRRKGMNRLMESLYVRSIAPRLRNQNLLIAREYSDKAAAHQFALDMTANDTLVQTGFLKKISELPVLRLYFGGRLERMSTNEFSEQLARSQVGQIIGKQDDASLRETIRGFAYDFERFGDAQTASFKKKAKVSAVLIGAIVATVLNVDILHTFQDLMANQNKAALIANTLTATPSVSNALASTGASAPDQVAAFQQAAATYEQFGLPIGSRFFPFCQKDPGTNAVADKRCIDGRSEGGVGVFSLTSGPSYDGKQVGNLWARVRSGDGDGLLWLISILFCWRSFWHGRRSGSTCSASWARPLPAAKWCR